MQLDAERETFVSAMEYMSETTKGNIINEGHYLNFETFHQT